MLWSRKADFPNGLCYQSQKRLTVTSISRLPATTPTSWKTSDVLQISPDFVEAIIIRSGDGAARLQHRGIAPGLAWARVEPGFDDTGVGNPAAATAAKGAAFLGRDHQHCSISGGAGRRRPAGFVRVKLVSVVI
jgi:hypothetical protein